jgi:hypothetical protein
MHGMKKNVSVMPCNLVHHNFETGLITIMMIDQRYMPTASGPYHIQASGAPPADLWHQVIRPQQQLACGGPPRQVGLRLRCL